MFEFFKEMNSQEAVLFAGGTLTAAVAIYGAVSAASAKKTANGAATDIEDLKKRMTALEGKVAENTAAIGRKVSVATVKEILAAERAACGQAPAPAAPAAPAQTAAPASASAQAAAPAAAPAAPAANDPNTAAVLAILDKLATSIDQTNANMATLTGRIYNLEHPADPAAAQPQQPQALDPNQTKKN